MFQVNSLSYWPDEVFRKSPSTASLNPHACPRFSFKMASKHRTVGDTSDRTNKHATRNPLLQRTTKEGQDRRRRAFLEKVRQVSDEKKWESRSEMVRDYCREMFLRRIQADTVEDFEEGFPVEAEGVGVCPSTCCARSSPRSQ